MGYKEDLQKGLEATGGALQKKAPKTTEVAVGTADKIANNFISAENSIKKVGSFAKDAGKKALELTDTSKAAGSAADWARKKFQNK